MKELINRIQHDLKQAEARRDAFEKTYGRDSREYGFNQAVVITLKTVLFDMRELRLTDEL
jgi:hypothetical protein